MPVPYRSGFVSIVGRPNVGKSTLLNAVLGQKIAIVSEKPQTTRNRIQGIKNLEEGQIVFIDTPGIHRPKTLLGKTMIRSVREVLKEIDVVIFVVEAGRPLRKDLEIIGSLREIDRPVILLINKIDLVKKAEILPLMAEYAGLFPFREIIPVSALKGEGVAFLVRKVLDYLPEGPRYFPDDLVTDQMERFMVSEIIREKIMKKTAEEVPYSTAVEIQNWSEREDGIIEVGATIYVERDGQKGIIIGKKGAMLKSIGTLARIEIERLLGAKVFLELWVKVRKGWRDDKGALDELGYR